tara:strand:+ start:1326 stop:2489 length:1164 start_codon:yes stop_codon:yes gene_type:complete
MGELIKKFVHVITELKKKENKSIFQVLPEILNYSSRLGLSPGEYFTYGFHSKTATKSYCLDYMPNKVHFKRHLATLNSSNRAILNDKILFKNAMQEANIPIPRTIGYAGPSKRSDLNFELITLSTIQETLSIHKITSFIVKPSNGTGGKGIYLVKYSAGENRPFNIKNQSMNTTDFFEYLTQNCEDLNGGYILFEYKVSSNDVLKEISPDASPNIRVITLRLPNGDIHVTSASMRLGRKNSITSNACSGGLVAGIDVKSGSIVNCRTTENIQGEFISNHPDTSSKIAGVNIPKWGDVLSTCIKAASAVESMKSVGWDVLLDNDSPVIIEGNDQWSIISEQMFDEGYLTPKNRELLAFYGLEFPKKNIPKPSLSNLKIALFGSGGKDF